MTVEELLEAGLMLDPKSMEITSLRKMVVRLRSEAEHHQNMSNFYRGEVKQVKEHLSSIRQKLARVSRMICFEE
ncbi:hypothetical protein AMTR_s00127p00050450 [Amborella trichopoda]|uniref:Uncharacterized protein n=1 Tax=Amborella trichopoda TaxID=13333 RepID=W1NQY1_AMBTC|nr:hypothetical protein AMTR_s00127p00050450 [Amborella trichopoda]